MGDTARAETSDRLVYEIVVTEPGTRSQGWHGVLYDPAGNPIVATPGETVTMPIGEFIDVPCSAPWDICGVIRMGPFRTDGPPVTGTRVDWFPAS